jgi:hypothetical protein
VLWVAKQIAEAVEAAHEKKFFGIIPPRFRAQSREREERIWRRHARETKNIRFNLRSRLRGFLYVVAPSPPRAERAALFDRI